MSDESRQMKPFPCKYDDPTCPCQDGDTCHYEGVNPMGIRPEHYLQMKNKAVFEIQAKEREVAALRQRVTELQAQTEVQSLEIGTLRGRAKQDELLRDAVQAETEKLRAERDALLEVTSTALRLLGGWREAVTELEDFCSEPVRLKNMLAAADQMDRWKQKALDARNAIVPAKK